MFCVLLTSMTD